MGTSYEEDVLGREDIAEVDFVHILGLDARYSL